MKELIREIEILKQKYLSKRNTFSIHKDEVKSESARDFLEMIDICVARILTEYEMQKTEFVFKGYDQTFNQSLPTRGMEWQELR